MGAIPCRCRFLRFRGKSRFDPGSPTIALSRVAYLFVCRLVVVRYNKYTGLREMRLARLRSEVSRSIMSLVVSGYIPKEFLYFLIDNRECDFGASLVRFRLLLFEANGCPIRIWCDILSLCVLFKKRALFQRVCPCDRRLGAYGGSLWFWIFQTDAITEFLHVDRFLVPSFVPLDFMQQLCVSLTRYIYPVSRPLAESHRVYLVDDPGFLQKVEDGANTRITLSGDMMTSLKFRNIPHDEIFVRRCVDWVLRHADHKSLSRFVTTAPLGWMSSALGLITHRAEELRPHIIKYCTNNVIVVPGGTLVPDPDGFVSVGFGGFRFVTIVDSTFDLSLPVVLIRSGVHLNRTLRGAVDLPVKFGGIVPSLRIRGHFSTAVWTQKKAILDKLGQVSGILDVGLSLGVVERSGCRSSLIPYSGHCHLSREAWIRCILALRRHPGLHGSVVFMFVYDFPGVDLSMLTCNDEGVESVTSALGVIGDSIPPSEPLIEGHRRMWSKLEPLLQAIPDKYRAAYYLSSGFPLHACGHAIHYGHKTLDAVLGILRRDDTAITAQVPFRPSISLPLLVTPWVPPLLKRVVLHNFIRRGVCVSPRTADDDSLEPSVHRDWVLPRVRMLYVPASGDALCITVSRSPVRVLAASTLRRFVSGMRLHNRNFRVVFLGEPGVGRGVLVEAVGLLFRRAIGGSVLVEYDATGYSIAPRGDLEEVGDTLTSDDLFVLGFLSSLCFARGLFLPCRLAHDFWDYIKSARDTPKAYFRRGILEFEKHAKDMSADVFMDTFGYYSPSKSKRRSFMKRLFVPDSDLVSAFREGIRFFTPADFYRPIETVSCNDVFSSCVCVCDFESFMCVVSETDRIESFLGLLGDLDIRQLERLLLFITGTQHLPDPSKGDPLISISRDNTLSLPKSHTCTNQLVLPDPVRCPDYRSLEIILNFASSYGYA